MHDVMWQGVREGSLFSADMVLAEALGSADMPLPTRRVDVDLGPISRVLSNPLVCHPNTAAEFQTSSLHRGDSETQRAVRACPLAWDTSESHATVAWGGFEGPAART